MKSNNLLTWTLYLLLAGLVLVFGYRACQLKKEQQAKQAEQTEMEQALRDLNYQTETGESSGVAKPGDLTDTKTAPTASTTTTTTTTTTAPAEKKVVATEKPAAKVEKTAAKTDAVKPVESSTEPSRSKFVDRNDENTTAKSTAKIAKTPSAMTKAATEKAAAAKAAAAKAAAPAGKKPAFAVIAGSFSDKANARKLMESLVKKGYENAEVSTKGKYFVVITHRTNDRADADKKTELLRKEADCAKAYVYKRP